MARGASKRRSGPSTWQMRAAEHHQPAPAPDSSFQINAPAPLCGVSIGSRRSICGLPPNRLGLLREGVQPPADFSRWCSAAMKHGRSRHSDLVGRRAEASALDHCVRSPQDHLVPIQGGQQGHNCAASRRNRPLGVAIRRGGDAASNPSGSARKRCAIIDPVVHQECRSTGDERPRAQLGRNEDPL